MAIKIGHASNGENGNARGGTAGDQTGKEVCTRNWYNGGWQFVARAKDKTKSEKMAAACEHGCNNPAIGYDQNGRNTLRAEAKKVGYNLNLIEKPCECDCSSFMGVCVEAAGIMLPDGNGPTTRTLRRVLEATGEFEILAESKYLTSDKYLLRGDILCKENSHTVMALDNGSMAEAETVVPTAPKTDTVTIYYSVRLPLLKRGSKGPAVENLQRLLIGHGHNLGSFGPNGDGVDGDFGTATEDALKEFQRSHVDAEGKQLEDDGECGGKTWAPLITT